MSAGRVQAMAVVSPIRKPTLKAETTRQRILEAARQHLRSGSYVDLSLDSVSKSAGVMRRAVLSQFSDKDELYRESRRSMIVELAEEFLLEIPQGMRPKDALNFFLRLLFDLNCDARLREVRMSAERDQRSQPWLKQSLDRLLLTPLLGSLEAFILRTTYCREVSGEVAAAIPRQLWSIAADLAGRRGAAVATGPTRLESELDSEIALAARAYGAALYQIGEAAA